MNKKYVLTLLVTAFGLTMNSCKQNSTDGNPGIKVEYMDTTVIPGNDFNQYANGVWLKKNPVPATESRWGSFNEIEDRNLDKLRSIVNETASDKDKRKRPPIGRYILSHCYG